MKAELIPFTNIGLRDSIMAHSVYLKLEAETEIVRSGQFIKSMPIVLSGSVDVFRKDEGNKELFLYSVNARETCAMTLQCCQSNQKSEITAITSVETELLSIPISFMEVWMNEFPEWKQFVLNSFSSKFKVLLKTIDSIAFQKLDERLIVYLNNKSQALNSSVLTLSHQVIAKDLNSSREVVSRLLKQLEKNGKVSLGRTKIELF